MRVILGLGESANFPAVMKVIADWHPKKRAHAGHRDSWRRR
ncbi:MAG: hypothetical protein ACSLEN_04370 [Candidatus Malihini olakiniferum]